jgi:hypothetical protein
MRSRSSFSLFIVCLIGFVTAIGLVVQPNRVSAQGIAGLLGGAFDTGPNIAGCPVYTTKNIWNTPVIQLPRSSHSDDYVARIGASSPLHPNFGSTPDNGIPVTFIGPNTPQVPVTFTFADESDPGPYPIPANVRIEGGPTAPPDSDRHMILVDVVRCLLYEVGGANPQPDGSWTAGAGIKSDLTVDMLRPLNHTTSDAAGLAILPGLLRYEEVAQGEIRHAIRFTAPQTQRAYLWPARHFASSITDETYPPMGARFRLKANFDISGFSRNNQIILRALKIYGMILADNGSSWFLTGKPDPRWNDDDLHQLRQISGSAFEAVDESALQMIPDSARADPTRVVQLPGGLGLGPGLGSLLAPGR